MHGSSSTATPVFSIEIRNHLRVHWEATVVILVGRSLSLLSLFYSYGSCPGSASRLAFQTMPNAYGHYANLVARHPHLKSLQPLNVSPPDIRDRNGSIIPPWVDYSLKHANQMPVFVTVKLRLWFIFLSNHQCHMFCCCLKYLPGGRSLPRLKKKG